MRYIIFVIDDHTESATGSEMQAIDAFNAKLRAQDHWIYAAGIGAPKSATIIDNRDGLNLVSAGSLFNSAEAYSGLWLIQATDSEQALGLASDASRACNRKVELRPFLGN